MANFVYTAKRSLIAGHVVDDSYSLEIDLQTVDPQRKRSQTRKVALDGVTMQTTFNNTTEGWAILTDHIALEASEDLPLAWIEFLDSVSGGEQFQFDAFGTDAVPRNLQEVKLTSTPQFQRIGATQNMTVSFEMLVVG